MPAWTLYYEDGSKFSSDDGAPHESPAWGVLSVVQPGKEPPIMVNADWLMYRDDLGEWTQCGADAFDDHASHFGHLISCWRKTRWTRTPNWKDVWARMHAELKHG